MNKGLREITQFLGRVDKKVRTGSGLAQYIPRMRWMRRIGSVSLMTLIGLVLLTIAPLYNVMGVEDGEAATGTAQDSTLTFSSTSLTASTSLDVNSTNGVFSTSANNQKASFTLTTNNYTGYTLALTGSSATTTLKDNVSNNTLSSIPSNTTLANFSADNSTGQSYNNKWGLLPSSYKSNNTVTTNNTTTYLPSPSNTGNPNTSYTIIMDETSTANSTAKSYTIGLGVRANYDVASGTYNNTNAGNTLTLAYVANPITYSITYDKGNTTDDVTGLPTFTGNGNTQSGSVSTTSITLSDAIPARTGYDFKGWCMGTISTANNEDSCTDGNGGTGTIFNANGANTPASLAFGIDKTTTNTTTLHAMWNIKTFICDKRYRLQDENGNWGDWQADGSTTTTYNGTCSYAKSITDYKDSADGTNDAQASTSASNVTSAQTLSLSFYRNTYTLTVSAGTNTSNPTGGGTYKWGQSVTVGVTKATDVTCTTYAAPTWTASTGTAPAAGASSSYIMQKSNATVTATSTASDVAQTITLSKGTGVNSITIAGTEYTGTSVSLNCGTYAITAPDVNFDSGYEFSSWGVSGSLSLSSSTTTKSNNMTVSGAGTLTLDGKSSKLYMQDLTLANCQKNVGTNGNAANIGDTITVYDKRDEKDYTVRYINGECWMTRNLRYLGDTGSAAKTMTMGNNNSNVTNKSITLYSLDSSNAGDFNDYFDNCDYSYGYSNGYNRACVYDSGFKKTGVWYNYYAATAGTVSSSSNSTTASQDICPKNWHLPTGPAINSSSEFYKLFNSTTINSIAANSYLAAFGAVAGGYYEGGSLNSTGAGAWWSATAYETADRYYLYYNAIGGTFNGRYYDLRYDGNFVRCVRT